MQIKREVAAMWLSELKGMTPMKCYAFFQSIDHIEDLPKYHVSKLNQILHKHFQDRSIAYIDEEEYKKHLDSISLYQERVENLLPDQHILLPDHPYFPEQLKNIPDCPIVLYARSKWLARLIESDPSCLNALENKKFSNQDMNVASLKAIGLPRINIGIVGARRCTLYAKDASYKLAKELAQAGFGIISGLAYGVDVAAHKGALKTGGFTMAVLGGGLDECYPPSHQALFQEISEKGMLVSEEWFGRKTEPYMFPKRNRIISGISRGVLVVEAAKKSGSLITVDFALEQGRDVYAVCGRILDPKAFGSNDLIRQGAKPVFSSQDIIADYENTSEISPIELGQSEKKLEEKEKIVYSCISYEPVHEFEIIDQINRMIENRTGEAEVFPNRSFNQEDITITLMILELKGLIRKISGCYYARSED